MMKIYKQTQKNIQRATVKFQQKANKNTTAKKTINIGDWVWIHLRKDRFPKHKINKLMRRVDGPLQIIKIYGDNAYKVDLSEEYGVSPIFNIGNLRPYYDAYELGTIRPKDRGNEPRPASGPNINNPELNLQSNTIQEHTYDSTNEILDSAAYTTMEDQLPNLSHRDVHGLHMKGRAYGLKPN